tara:strand:+ start:560 stop:688 length:129 start_codon:yes stop_codon:yes gene_type:complete
MLGKTTISLRGNRGKLALTSINLNMEIKIQNAIDISSLLTVF